MANDSRPLMVATRLLALAALTAACGGEPGARGPEAGQARPAARGVRRLDGSTITTAEIDRTVTRLMAAARVPGLALAIINDGAVVHLEGYGYRDVAAREPMTEDTIMVGASFTKSAFATAVMQLVGGRTTSRTTRSDPERS